MLTHMIAHVCGMKPDMLHMTYGDYHVYSNHFDQAQEQLTREPFVAPSLTINRQVTDIEDFNFEDFTLHNYHCYDTIKAPMAV